MSKISINLVTWNGEKYIKHCINSVLEQTFQDFELIFIDDGSTDGTYNEIIRLSGKFGFLISAFRQKNKGVSAARNYGIGKSKGKYICFCDVDDAINVNFFDLMLAPFNRDNMLDLSICKYKIYRNNSENIEMLQVPNGKYEHYLSRKTMLDKLLFLKLHIIHCCMMVKKDFLIKHNIHFAEGYRYGEDFDFLWRVLINVTQNVCYLDFPLYYYVWNPHSAMSVFNESRLDTLVVYAKLEAYVTSIDKKFAVKFCKYWKSRSLWSTMRQGATKMSYSEFLQLCRSYDVRANMSRLLFYRDFKVILTAFLFCISPFLFYEFFRIIKINVH